MLAFTLVLYSLLVAPSFALPTTLLIPKIDTSKILCQLPIVKKFLCPLKGSAALTRVTPLGTASGVQDPDGAYRFAVKYASASRWAPSTVATTWQLPNGSNNASAIPLACPQPGVDSSAFSEDCLSMILYVPPALTLTSNAPTFVWIHGGSFFLGSAAGVGLDGSALAIATNSIVAVIQYRLGALGLMAPNGATNLAVKDVVNSLQFLKKVVPFFGGGASMITLAGQSSGAHMIRALLAVPSASSLFRSAILESDPMNFGFLSTTTQSTMQTYFNGLVNCGATDTACQNGLSVITILNAEVDLFNNAIDLDPAAGRNEPMRPVLDGSFITSPLDSTAPFPSVNKPLLITNVKDEGAFGVWLAAPSPLPAEALAGFCSIAFDAGRTSTILASPFYVPTPSANGDVDARFAVEQIATDYLWRCSGYTFARSWVGHGGTAYVGQFNIGASYPGNEAVSICTQPGVVCHQDDIQIVFGTVDNPTSAQAALTTEVQKRYKAFLQNGNPNAAGLPTWQAATTSNVHPLVLGTTGEVPLGACVPSFWGSSVQYDYQFFNE